MYIKQEGLFLMCTTRMNVSPSLIAELLLRFARVFRDYCGVLDEESIRKNFVLIYELLDEMLDFGYPQATSSDSLKAFVYNKPATSASNKLLESIKFPDMNSKTTPSTSVNKPITDQGKTRNEIFVDIIERVSVTFNSNGRATVSDIDGAIQMKSYLSGNPELRLALNEELVIGSAPTNTFGVVAVDDCNFHECIRLEEFEASRVLALRPPDGEFTVMNYRISGEFRAPFRVFPFVSIVSEYLVEVILKIRCDIPETNHGANIVVTMPVPKNTSSASWTHGTAQGVKKSSKDPYAGHSVAFDQKTKQIKWSIKKLPGGSEVSVNCKLVLDTSASGGLRREVGPVTMEFEVPMYNVSGLQVRYLRILESSKKYNPYRWVRYITKSSSYVCRV